MILPPICHRVQHTPSGDMTLIPLMECLTTIIQAIGVHYQSEARYTLHRALGMIRDTLLANALEDANESGDVLTKDFIVVGLDILSGMAQGFGPSFSVVVDA